MEKLSENASCAPTFYTSNYQLRLAEGFCIISFSLFGVELLENHMVCYDKSIVCFCIELKESENEDPKGKNYMPEYVVVSLVFVMSNLLSI